MRPVRLRRLRRNDNIREWVSQTRLSAGDIILPYFVTAGKGVKEPVESMPGVYHLSVDNVVKDLSDIPGIKAILLFGVPRKKDAFASEAYEKNSVIQDAIRAIKDRYRHLVVITDVCLCGYTPHGHCGIVKRNKKFTIDNDSTLEILSKIALSHAAAGADFVAPSAMMDGQVKAIRTSLDSGGFKDAGILSYSAKFASAFYGPFRDALNSEPKVTDRKSYQMDYRNYGEALREVEEDITEGADIIMIKPSLAYLDIIHRVKERFNIPLAAYNVSGEYSMIKMLAGGDKKKETSLALEVLASIKRAGADFIITYFAREVAKRL